VWGASFWVALTSLLISEVRFAKLGLVKRRNYFTKVKIKKSIFLNKPLYAIKNRLNRKPKTKNNPIAKQEKSNNTIENIVISMTTKETLVNDCCTAIFQMNSAVENRVCQMFDYFLTVSTLVCRKNRDNLNVGGKKKSKNNSFFLTFLFFD
jgi:hypothetical protein